MKIQLHHAAACAAATILSVFTAVAATEGAKTLTPVERSPAQERQQDKMKRCNVEAREKALKGDERRAFMSACLKS